MIGEVATTLPGRLVQDGAGTLAAADESAAAQ
nr:MetaGeneMark_Unknown Function [uncultured bacterium]